MEADMRIGAKHFLAGVAVLALGLPVWARTESSELDVDHSVTIAGKQLSPGDYELKVEDNGTQVTVTKYGDVVVQVPCHWIQLPNKADSTEVKSSDNQITEIDFKGKTEAVQLP
jgi:hypothetical protein